MKNIDKGNIKAYEFYHSGGKDVVLAEFPRQAINHYFNNFNDDLLIDDMILDGIRIKEVTEDGLDAEFNLHDEDFKNKEVVTYIKIIEEYEGIIPDVIITPNYWYLMKKITFYEK